MSSKNRILQHSFGVGYSLFDIQFVVSPGNMEQGTPNTNSDSHRDEAT